MDKLKTMPIYRSAKFDTNGDSESIVYGVDKIKRHFDAQAIGKNKALLAEQAENLMRSIKDRQDKTERELKQANKYEQNENYGKF